MAKLNQIFWGETSHRVVVWVVEGFAILTILSTIAGIILRTL